MYSYEELRMVSWLAKTHVFSIETKVSSKCQKVQESWIFKSKKYYYIQSKSNLQASSSHYMAYFAPLTCPVYV